MALLVIAVFGWSLWHIVVDVQTVVERVEGRPLGPLLTQLMDALKILGTFPPVVVTVVLSGTVSILVQLPPKLAVWSPIGLFPVLTVTLLPLYSLPSRVVHAGYADQPGAVTAAFRLRVLVAAIQFFAGNTAL